MQYSDLEFEPVDWKDYPSNATKLNAKNLNNAENGILKLIKATIELRELLGHEDLETGSIITAVNELNGKFGGYQGYNLFDLNELKETANGFIYQKTLDEAGLKAGKTYSISMEGDFDIYVYELDSAGETLALHSLADDSKTDLFTLNANCTSISILFAKGQGYISLNYCKAARFMLEYGSVCHSYEPYTGGKEMTNLWEEIANNMNNIARNQTKIVEMEENIQSMLDELTDILGGEY